jgi:hypothetical protein
MLGKARSDISSFVVWCERGNPETPPGGFRFGTSLLENFRKALASAPTKDHGSSRSPDP